MRNTLGLVVMIGCLLSPVLPAQNTSGTATLVSKDNRVDVARGGGGWSAASAGEALNIGDRIRTGEDSRAKVRMGDGSVLELDELTTIEIKPPKEAGTSATLRVPSGAAYFFSRGKSREVAIETPSANGAIRGTAFLLTVAGADGRTSVAMIEGAFELSSGGGSVMARQGDQARAGADGTGKDRYPDRGDTAPWYLVIESRLASLQNLRSVGKAQFLEALPSAIQEYRQVAPQLAGGATIVRKDWARDILREGFKAAGPDCGMRGRILHSVIAADPEEAAALTELAIALAPDCAGAFGGGSGAPKSGEEGFGNPPVIDNFGNPPGFATGGGGQGNLIAICHNGQTIFLSPSDAERFLRDHPGATVGQCQVTSIQNR